MQLTFISDTHAKHHELNLASGDILIHCGDFTRFGELEDTEEFAEFMAAQDFQHKIVIAGNHDWCFEDYRRRDAEKILNDAGIVYLHDSGLTINNVNFWGSPYQPKFCNWAFNCKRGEELKAHWDLIPTNIDVLLTHTPPFGILDECYDGVWVGCIDLRESLERIQPKIHAFGHIHESYGVYEQNGKVFVNACSLNGEYEMENAPVILTI